MALISGSVKCINCGKEIKWCFQIAQRMSGGGFEVDTLPNDTIMLNANPQIKKAGVHCRNCDCLNEIENETT